MHTLRLYLLVFASLFFAVEAGAVGVTLKGSPASIERQHLIAKDHGFTFVETPDQVPELVESSELIPVTGNDHYDVHPGVSNKVARPEMRLFIERLGKQYLEGTGERLVVTSLTRAASQQPRNSHPLSVHPTGMAVDLRISDNGTSRAWLESVLLRLERQGVLDVTRERFPPHYHVALFPEAYTQYLNGIIGEETVAEALKFEDKKPEIAELEPEKTPMNTTRVAAAATTARVVVKENGRWVALALIPLMLVPAVLLLRKKGLLETMPEDEANI